MRGKREQESEMDEKREIEMLRGNSTDAIIIIGIDKTITACNSFSLKLFKTKKTTIAGADFKKFIISKLTTLNLKKLLRYIDKEEYNFDIEIQLKENSDRFILSSSFVNNDETAGLVRLVIKKTENRKEEEVKIDLSYLTNISSELSEINNEDAVFEFLGTKLHELFPKGIILINRSNAEGTWIKVEKTFGIQSWQFEEIIAAVGYNPMEKSFRIIDKFKQQFSKPKLHKHTGTLYDFCNNELPKPIALLLEKTLHIKTIHTIGIAHQDQFFGFIHLLNTTTNNTFNGTLLESIVFQCYLSIARIKSLKALEESEKQYKLLADNVKDVIFTLDLNLNYTYVSPSIKTLRGYEPSELIGQPVFNSLSAKSGLFVAEFLQEQFEKVQNGTLGFSDHFLFEIESISRVGNLIWNEVKASFIFDKENKPIGIMGVTRDINERKLAEKELLNKNIELNEANAQKDKFFSIIAHDLKNPFGHILNFSSLLKDRYHQYPEEKRKQFIDLINKSSYQIYILLENLLDWSRSQGRKMDFFPQMVRLDKIITDVIDLLNYSATSKNIELIKRVPIKVTLNADEYMLRTIFRNLIGNAIKFTPDGGQVIIDVKEKKSGLTITISDTGIGMDSELITSLFSLDPNISRTGTKGEKGTGLGLILCKEFVEKHGGLIRATSFPGKGSSFTFNIPSKLPVE